MFARHVGTGATEGELSSNYMNIERFIQGAGMHAQPLSCLPLYDPMDCDQPGSSLTGILQSGILEWVVICSFIESF